MEKYCWFLWLGFWMASGGSGFPAEALPAFPGAEGAGSRTPGGRGGKVLLVTNLNDSGPGSLREACNTSGPRIIVFRVAGVITLEKPIVIKHPFLTIAGQSAPGEGVCIRKAALVIETTDVVIRYFRSRLGDIAEQQQDCISIGKGAQRVILDQCSVSWSLDEALSLQGDVRDCTVQWCLIAESLNQSKHSKGSHGCGTLARANGLVSMHHNLWAHHDSRNPRFGDNYGRPPYPRFDFRHNVIYDYGSICSGLVQGTLEINYVGNYIRPARSSRNYHMIRISGPSQLKFFLERNIVDGQQSLTDENREFIRKADLKKDVSLEFMTSPFPASPIQTTSALSNLEEVLTKVGATLPVRDAVDKRLVWQVRERQGGIIDSQEEVGGWPELKMEEPLPDRDKDGMPDEWEQRYSLNASEERDALEDLDNDGYTNIEEYLNGTDPKEYRDYRRPENNRSSLQPR